jgi:hypothetical protein
MSADSFLFFSGLDRVDRFLPGGGAVEVSGAGLAGHPLNGHGDAVGGSGIGVEQRQPAAPGRRCQQARHAHGAAAPQPTTPSPYHPALAMYAHVVTDKKWCT